MCARVHSPRRSPTLTLFSRVFRSIRGQFRQGLCLLVGLLISVDKLLEAKSRWRQLRSHAGALESIIWRFRTRVGSFASTAHASEAHKPEQVLCRELTDWIDDLVSGANLAATDFNRKYPSHVYKHHQYKDPRKVNTKHFFKKVKDKITTVATSNTEGEKVKDKITTVATSNTEGEGGGGEAGAGAGATRQDEQGEEEHRDPWDYETHGDDFQAPCKPEDYIQLRLKKAEAFYTKRCA